MTRSRALIALLCSGLVLAGVIALSRDAQASPEGNLSLFKLSWSVLPERIEVCRTLSAEELASRPAHMRQKQVCEGHSLAYRLTVRVDGRLRADEVLHGGGVRRDRRVYVFREYPVRAGAHSFAVTFFPIDSAGNAVATDSAGATGAQGVPTTLQWSGNISVAPGRVGLLAYDGLRHRLDFYRSPPPPR